LTKNSSSNLDYKLIQRILKQEKHRLEKKGEGGMKIKHNQMNTEQKTRRLTLEKEMKTLRTRISNMQLVQAIAHGKPKS
jgi:hypothetical protein